MAVVMMGTKSVARLALAAAVVATVLLVGCGVRETAAATTIEAYKLAHVSTSQGTYGSTAVSFSGRQSRDVTTRGVLLLTWRELSRLPSLVSLKCTSLIVTLPTPEEQRVKNDRVFWHTLKQRMLTMEWSTPVYFVRPDAPHVQDMLATGPGDAADSSQQGTPKTKGKVDFGALVRGSYRLKVEAAEPMAHTNLPSPALHIHLRGSSDDKPILLVAHYDTNGAVPGAAVPDGTGASAALHFLQQLSQLYREASVQPTRSVHVLLVGQSSLGYAPLSAWIEHYRPPDLAFAVCLSSLSNVEHSQLFAHVSKHPQEGTDMHQFVQLLNTTATKRGLPLTLVHRKINLAYDLRSWEHEQFSLHKPRTPAMTLSTLPTAPAHGTLFSRSERREEPSTAVTSNVTAALCEAVADFLLDSEDQEEDNVVRRESVMRNLQVQPHMVEAWLQHMRENPLLPHDDPSAATSFLEDVQHYLSKHHSVTARLMTFDITASPVIPYSPVKANLEVQHTAAPGLELAVIAGAAAYSLLVYIASAHILSSRSPSAASSTTTAAARTSGGRRKTKHS